MWTRTITMSAALIGVAFALTACSTGGIQPLAADKSGVMGSGHAGTATGAGFAATRYVPNWMRFADPGGRATVRLFEPYVATVNTNEGSGSFIAQYLNHDPSGAPLCTLPGAATDYIGGVGVDKKGNLYVPQSAGSGTAIDVYGPHCGSLVNTLNYTSGNQPQQVAVDGKTVYAIDSSYRDPQVQVFANGATSPTGTLSDPSVYQALGLAVDSLHDVFLSYYNPTAGTNSVIEFPGGTAPGTILPMSGGYGLLVDKANDLLYIGSNQSTVLIDVYAPPYTGAPIETITGKGNAQHGPTNCAFGASYSRIDCGDTTYQSLDFFAYPSGAYVYSLLLPYSPYTLTYSVANLPSP